MVTTNSLQTASSRQPPAPRPSPHPALGGASGVLRRPLVDPVRTLSQRTVPRGPSPRSGPSMAPHTRRTARPLRACPPRGHQCLLPCPRPCSLTVVGGGLLGPWGVPTVPDCLRVTVNTVWIQSKLALISQPPDYSLELPGEGTVPRGRGGDLISKATGPWPSFRGSYRSPCRRAPRGRCSH